MKKEYYYICYAILFAGLAYLFTNQWVCALLLFLLVSFDCFFIIRKTEWEKEIKRREGAYRKEFLYRYALHFRKDKTQQEIMQEVVESFVGQYEEIDKEELAQSIWQEEIEKKINLKKLTASLYKKWHVEALKNHIINMKQEKKNHDHQKELLLSYFFSILAMIGLRILLYPYYQQILSSSISFLMIFFFIISIWLSVHFIFFRKEDSRNEEMECEDVREE